MANKAANNFGPRALAKFEGVARASRRQENIGIRKELVQAGSSNPAHMRSLFRQTNSMAPASIQDSSQLSPEALELLNNHSK